ncbi:hypothetical protein [Mixta calida]|uniref:hypothetical protein n=1 Tax=Mixta calida TaxID=665913 RepID=UPI003F683140
MFAYVKLDPKILSGSYRDSVYMAALYRLNALQEQNKCLVIAQDIESESKKSVALLLGVKLIQGSLYGKSQLSINFVKKLTSFLP